MALGALLCGRHALAQPPDRGAPDVGGAGANGEARRTTAKIVLIGVVADDRELGLLFSELLGREGVAVEISNADRFDPSALFGPEDAGVTRVFVVSSDGRQARLHFRGPGEERYLLRRVTLPNGLDAVGRELLGQVVESSVVALLSSSEGLNREEAAAELERDEAVTPAPATAATASSSSGSSTHPPARAASSQSLGHEPSRWQLHFALRYAATWSGGDLGLAHGPGLAGGVRYRTRPSLGLELGAERYFEQTLSTPALEARIQHSVFYALVEVGHRLSAKHSAFVAVGPVLELSRTHPESAAPDVTLTAAKTALAPALRAELRYELGHRTWLFGLAARVDVSLSETHYELLNAGEHERLATRAIVRPGAVFTVGIR